jgi:small subunit ribosomal protein S20
LTTPIPALTLARNFKIMANTKSAAKRARQTQRRTLRNRPVLSRIRTLSKNSGTPNAQTKDIRALISAVDKAAKRGIIHRNAANRRKARLRQARAAATSTEQTSPS